MAPHILIIQAAAVIVCMSVRAVDPKVRSAQDNLLPLIEQHDFLIAASTTLTAEDASDVIDATMGTTPASVVPPETEDQELAQQTSAQSCLDCNQTTALRRQIKADSVPQYSRSARCTTRPHRGAAFSRNQ